MDNPTNRDHEVEALLRQLEHVLADEKRALTALDISAVTQAAEDKLLIQERLIQSIDGAPLAERSRPLLERVKKTALENQILLVNARDTVRGLLQELTGAPGSGYARGGAQRLGGGSRLDARG